MVSNMKVKNIKFYVSHSKSRLRHILLIERIRYIENFVSSGRSIRRKSITSSSIIYYLLSTPLDNNKLLKEFYWSKYGLSK